MQSPRFEGGAQACRRGARDAMSGIHAVEGAPDVPRQCVTDEDGLHLEVDGDLASRLLEQRIDETEVECQLGTGVVGEDVHARVGPGEQRKHPGAIIDEQIVVLPLAVRRAHGVTEVDPVAPEARVE